VQSEFLTAQPTATILIYLDNNATTKLSPEVIDRMTSLMHDQLANPSSQHAEGRRARQVVEQARETILKFCGARTIGMVSDSLLFTSGGTEANNLALFGLSKDRPGSIVVSAIEHPSVLAAAEVAASQGRQVHLLQVDSSGVASIHQLESLIEQHAKGDTIALVSLMLANNETGVLQLVREASRLCRNHGILIHTDAVQVIGKARLNFEELDVDAMTITAHKIHGPIGIAALILRHGVSIKPTAFGGFQQLGLRPGTEMPMLTGGFETAVHSATRDYVVRAQAMQLLRDSLQQQLESSIRHCTVVGRDADRLPHTLSVAFPGVNRQALQLALDMSGIACSTGSACASGSSQPSHVLQAMRLDPKVIQGGVRFSLSAQTSQAEIDETARQLARIVPSLCKS
jgi:cysteine desulfurase